MRFDRRRRRVLLIVASGVASAVLALGLNASGALDDLETASVDKRFQIRGTHDVPSDIVVVGIDDVTMQQLGLRPPFRRSVHAEAIRRLTAAGAKVIAYDIQFSEPTTPFDDSRAARDAAEADDVALLDAMAASKRVVLGDSEVENGEPSIVYTDEDLAAASVQVGNVNFTDGRFSRLAYRLDGMRTFAVTVADRATGGETPESRFGADGVRVDYHGERGTIAEIPFSRVVTGGLRPDEVRNKIVVVGNTSNTLGDVHPTPLGGLPMSGPEINANAVSTVLRGIPLRDSSAVLNAVILLGLVALATAAGLRGALAGGVAAVALIGLSLLLAQVVFDGGRVLDVAAPVLAVALSGLAALAVNYWTLVRDRARLRTEFGRFLPAPVVDDVIDEAGDSGRLGGRRLYATVVFADLRGFTAAAERLPPELVIDVLNRYLTEMSDAVLDHGGTLVAYQGDGLMAVFGAPVEQPDHADRALAAAREMRDVRLPRFNAWAAGEGVSEGFRMGIGVASGPVMSGNVGSRRRLEYAAVGDTTNTAARLEGLTKDTPHMLLIADATRGALTRTVPDLAAVGALDVRGREVPAGAWTLAEMRAGPAEAGPADADVEGGFTS